MEFTLRFPPDFDPEQVKRQEIIGIAALLMGTLSLIAGFFSVIFFLYAGLLLVASGVVAAAVGVHWLTSIPDVMTVAES